MDIFVMWLLSLSLLLIGSVTVLTLFSMRAFRSSHRRMLRAQATSELRTRQLIDRLSTTMLQQSKEQTRQQQLLVGLVDRAMVLVGTADPLAYQQVQAMETTPSQYDEPQFDPSDEAEIERIARRNRNLQAEEDDLNGFERSILGDLGIEPEFIFGGESDTPG